ncbi:MAG: spheroidene monooxygenase [Flavobacteriales bacterium]|jgi:heme-degrading monooxygenase HmoA|nr:spheroidene monooxygenase [Flavobacteriales bacterium]
MKPEPTTPSRVYIDFFQFESHRYWAFKQMLLGPIAIQKTSGLQFFKFLGTGGGNGFSLRPDFGTYAVLTLWDSPRDYQNFTANHPYWKTYQKKAAYQRTIGLVPVHSHGKWNGNNPFANHIEKTTSTLAYAPVAVLTRATLNWNRLLSFWRSVPHAARTIETAKGVLFYKGVGEWPWVQQATVSIWENFEAVNTFAYKHRGHAEIVRKTKAQKWYKEDLFSRFVVASDTQFQPTIQ